MTWRTLLTQQVYVTSCEGVGPVLKRKTSRSNFLAEVYRGIRCYYSYVICKGLAVVKRMYIESGYGVQARGICVCA